MLNDAPRSTATGRPSVIGGGLACALPGSPVRCSAGNPAGLAARQFEDVRAGHRTLAGFSLVPERRS